MLFYINIEEEFETKVNFKHKESVETFIEMAEAIVYKYLLKMDSVSVPHWHNKFKSTKDFLKAQKYLVDNNIINSEVRGDYATMILKREAIWLDDKALSDLRIKLKGQQYMLSDTVPNINNKVLCKRPSGIKSFNNERDGFKRNAEFKFRFDTEMIKKYYSQIESNLNNDLIEMMKKYKSLRDELHYTEISSMIIKAIIQGNSWYYAGDSLVDSRGRQVYDMLKKVFNPVSNKDARALMVVEPYKMNTENIKYMHLFIAELLGIKAETEFSKQKAGFKAYKQRLFNNSSSTKHIHEDIWLERLYAELDGWYLDNNHLFTTPVEIDFTASMLVVEGLLLGDRDMLESTNVIGDTLSDVWTIDGLEREQVKKYFTPHLYGSQASPQELWRKNKLEFNSLDVAKIKFEAKNGVFKNAMNFGDFILDNVVPKETMELKIGRETITVDCNRFDIVGEHTIKYYTYTSDKEIVSFCNTSIKKVPNLKQFKRFFITALIHNLDSQLINYIMKHVNGISIHDAIVLSGNQVEEAKQKAVNFMEYIYDNRKEILHNYFTSIGISDTKSKEFIEHNVQMLNDDDVISGKCMK